MRTSFIAMTLAGLFASSMAVPAMLANRQTLLCSSGDPKCCDVDVLGIADLDCETPAPYPTNITDFNDVCAAVGKINMCCTLNLLGQGLLCDSPDGS